MKKLIMYLFKFIYDNRLLYFSYIITLSSILFVFYLSNLDFSIFKDALMFSMLVMGLLSLYLLKNDYQKSQQLQRIKNYANLTISSLTDLPNISSINEAHYQKLLSQALIEKNTVMEQLEIQNQQLNDYYSMWSHQIKTPIAALQLLLQVSPDNIKAMETEVFRIEEYLQMMLNYIKLNHVNDDLVLRPIDLEKTVKQVVKKYATFFINNDLSVTLSGFSKQIITDEKWLTFIIEQIVSNSLKYTRKGGITITQNDYSLTIQDTGIGILPEDIPRIFEKGYTGFNGREHQKATGLGLYMCHEIANKLNIELDAHSIVNSGTTIIITFPQFLNSFD